ncbi:hypothetical protein ACOME3_002585 [Neoechinorhynchus agilis]
MDEVCKETGLDQNEYVFRTKSDGAVVPHSLRLRDLANSKDDVVLELVPALKHCDLAETEQSVDRMYSSRSVGRPSQAHKADQRKTVCFSDAEVCTESPTRNITSFRSVNEYVVNEYTSSIRNEPTIDETVASRQKRRAPPPPGSLVCMNHPPEWSLRSKSTIEDISEDFQQALMMGRETLFAKESSDQSTQTCVEFEPAKPFHIDQSVQTSDAEFKTVTLLEHSYVERRKSLEYAIDKSPSDPVGNLCSVMRDLPEVSKVHPLIQHVQPSDSYRRRFAAGSSNVSRIIRDHDRLLPIHVSSIIHEHLLFPMNCQAIVLASKEKPLKVPVAIEVTERTTLVQCTVTVEAEGKIVSSTTRALEGEGDLIVGNLELNDECIGNE